MTRHKKAPLLLLTAFAASVLTVVTFVSGSTYIRILGAQGRGPTAVAPLSSSTTPPTPIRGVFSKLAVTNITLIPAGFDVLGIKNKKEAFAQDDAQLVLREVPPWRGEAVHFPGRGAAPLIVPTTLPEDSGSSGSDSSDDDSSDDSSKGKVEVVDVKEKNVPEAGQVQGNQGGHPIHKEHQANQKRPHTVQVFTHQVNDYDSDLDLDAAAFLGGVFADLSVADEVKAKIVAP